MLLGFVEQIGHDVSSIAESIMEYALDEDTLVESDVEEAGVVVVADKVLRRAREHDDEDDAEHDNSGSE
ncbi:MAG: hypothetical protein JWR01_2890 [Subtercola sp.]|nr:hypothetical protein [Subtercola sp.]